MGQLLSHDEKSSELKHGAAVQVQWSNNGSDTSPSDEIVTSLGPHTYRASRTNFSPGHQQKGKSYSSSKHQVSSEMTNQNSSSKHDKPKTNSLPRGTSARLSGSDKHKTSSLPRGISGKTLDQRSKTSPKAKSSATDKPRASSLPRGLSAKVFGEKFKSNSSKSIAANASTKSPKYSTQGSKKQRASVDEIVISQVGGDVAASPSHYPQPMCSGSITGNTSQVHNTSQVVSLQNSDSSLGQWSPRRISIIEDVSPETGELRIPEYAIEQISTKQDDILFLEDGSPGSTCDSSPVKQNQTSNSSTDRCENGFERPPSETTGCDNASIRDVPLSLDVKEGVSLVNQVSSCDQNDDDGALEAQKELDASNNNEDMLNAHAFAQTSAENNGRVDDVNDEPISVDDIVVYGSSEPQSSLCVDAETVKQVEELPLEDEKVVYTPVDEVHPLGDDDQSTVEELPVEVGTMPSTQLIEVLSLKSLAAEVLRLPSEYDDIADEKIQSTPTRDEMLNDISQSIDENQIETEPADSKTTSDTSLQIDLSQSALSVIPEKSSSSLRFSSSCNSFPHRNVSPINDEVRRHHSSDDVYESISSSRKSGSNDNALPSLDYAMLKPFEKSEYDEVLLENISSDDEMKSCVSASTQETTTAAIDDAMIATHDSADCQYTCHQRCRNHVTLDCENPGEINNPAMTTQTTTTSTSSTSSQAALSPLSPLFHDSPWIPPSSSATLPLYTPSTNRMIPQSNNKVSAETSTDSGFATAADTTACQFEGLTLKEKIHEYNSLSHSLTMTLDEEYDTFQGSIRVHLNLSRPISMAIGTRPPSIYEVLAHEEIKEDDSLTTSFYLPRNVDKPLHISSSTTAREVITILLKKFHITDNPMKFALYEHYTEEDNKGCVYSGL
ncbi:uncharacterized protein LOC141901180 isoform X2 [Tubulanus polymorphus]|uniref:uncharacterized protein LOC141901180 isoform X2 n=1 Tax=Tubulanus polymorphus TaxID=672921 RepID=UPI003DA688BE